MEVVASQISIEKIQRMAEVLKVIGHPIRLKVIELLSEKEMSVTELIEKIEIEQSLLSHHLVKMKDVGILQYRRDGKNIFYSLKEQQLTQVFDCMEKCSSFF